MLSQSLAKFYQTPAKDLVLYLLVVFTQNAHLQSIIEVYKFSCGTQHGSNKKLFGIYIHGKTLAIVSKDI